MKIITKTKLPKWFISKLHLGEEDQQLGSVVVPMLLFPLMAIGILWYEFHSPSWVMLEIIATVAIVVAIFATALWIVVQVDVLIILRKRYCLLYDATQNPEEKMKIKEKLMELCVSV